MKSSEINNVVSHLEILGLKSDATLANIKAAYKEMLMVWHPDRFPQDSPIQQKALEQTKKINAAYEYLKDYQPPSRKRSDDEFDLTEAYESLRQELYGKEGRNARDEAESRTRANEEARRRAREEETKKQAARMQQEEADRCAREERLKTAAKREKTLAEISSLELTIKNIQLPVFPAWKKAGQLIIAIMCGLFAISALFFAFFQWACALIFLGAWIGAAFIWHKFFISKEENEKDACEKRISELQKELEVIKHHN